MTKLKLGVTITVQETGDADWPWKATGMVPNIGTVIKLDSSRERAIARVKARFNDEGGKV